ncbi:HlyD family efflux transporter periplasmic adaptor subunit [Rhizobium cauense]|uniref:HlyD family efflux transporter periplasmic adaptor subunit n=1 Tax=Rhizobium cauense TaxID=1166683 RepID=UPI0030B8EE78
MRAPVDGFVYDLQVHTIGGIITSGATVMSVVPKSGDLIVEVHRDRESIRRGRLQLGRPTKTRLPSSCRH